MSLLLLFEFDVVDENFAVAGYANVIAFIEFADLASVNSEAALDDAATDIFAFEADFVEIPGKVSLALRPNISDIVESGRDHIVAATAEGAVREIGLEDQMRCSAVRAVILFGTNRAFCAAGGHQAEHQSYHDRRLFYAHVRLLIISRYAFAQKLSIRDTV